MKKSISPIQQNLTGGGFDWNAKRCKRCKELKPVDQFHKDNSMKYGTSKVCAECHITDNRDHRLEVMAKYRHQARIDAIAHYGGKCACCGEDRPEFLAIDHIHGGGGKHHKEIKGMAIGIWLKKQGYPEGFRVLCHNCNQSLGHFGYCPHGNLPPR